MRVWSITNSPDTLTLCISPSTSFNFPSTTVAPMLPRNRKFTTSLPLILARDSSAGHGQKSSTSVYRHADVFDISSATNVKSPAHDAFNGSIASTTGVLNADVVPATYCPWLDYNINAQLNRFGVHNGGAQDSTLLNEKWESLALAPVSDDDDDKDGKEYFLISVSDNDFITQNGTWFPHTLYVIIYRSLM